MMLDFNKTILDMVYLDGHCPMDSKEFMEYT